VRRFARPVCPFALRGAFHVFHMALPVPEHTRDLFVEEWLASTLGTYPEQAGRFLRDEQDPFRNPVGHTLRVALASLAAELFGEFDRGRVARALEAVVRIRAVQEFTPSEAVGFVPLARSASRVLGRGPELAPECLGVLDRRIDELVLMAFDLFEKCREEIRAISTRAARRRAYVVERIHGATDDRDVPAEPLPLISKGELG
jgi:hypothetical protein